MTLNGYFMSNSVSVSAILLKNIRISKTTTKNEWR